MECVYVRQAQALGLGHAVLCGRRLVGNEPFAVLLPDDLMIGTPPMLAQMVEQFDERRASIVAVQEVPAEHTRRYGIVGGTRGRRPPGRHRPDRREAGARGRAVAPRRRRPLRPDAAACSTRSPNQPRGVGGEIQLTDGIAGLLRHEKVFAYRYEGRRYDCGSKEGFLQANVELALEHPELGRAGSAQLPARRCDALSARRASGGAGSGRTRRSRSSARRSSLPVWRAKAWKSRTEPGSVATTFSTSPLDMSASAFFAFRIGSGQFRPRVSISFCASMVLSPSVDRPLRSPACRGGSSIHAARCRASAASRRPRGRCRPASS